MTNLIKKITKNNKTILLIALVCISFGLLIQVDYVKAEIDYGKYGALASNTIGYGIALILSWIAYIITAVVGFFITVLIKILVSVAQFNHIIDVETVKNGWVIVRDLANMFFVLVLLVIAFATILRIESYNAKRLLPKLLIMAILINFSKMIFGLIIDFSQVIMLTFVNSFASGNGWFIDMFNVKNLFSINTFKRYVSGESAFTGWALAMAVIASVLASIITLIVIAVILAVLVIRIVMLWIYTILSPLVFLGFAFPPYKSI